MANQTNLFKMTEEFQVEGGVMRITQTEFCNHYEVLFDGCKLGIYSLKLVFGVDAEGFPIVDVDVSKVDNCQ